jgi:DNA-binding transcriptional LysR family regulator
MNDSLSTLRLFVRIAHRGSFSVGARELNVPQPTASRTIAALERELGTALLVRTTRAVSLTDASATARRISTWPRILAASPAYLAREGAPNAPEELARHAMIIGPAAQGGAWSFRKDGHETSVRVRGRVTVTLNEVATAAAVAGLGVASMTLGACRKELGDGSLIRLLPEWDMGTIELSAVFAAGRAAKPSARAFSKFLFAEFASAETA